MTKKIKDDFIKKYFLFFNVTCLEYTASSTRPRIMAGPGLPLMGPGLVILGPGIRRFYRFRF